MKTNSLDTWTVFTEFLEYPTIAGWLFTEGTVLFRGDPENFGIFG